MPMSGDEGKMISIDLFCNINIFIIANRCYSLFYSLQNTLLHHNMTVKCCAKSCTSDDKTVIDGEKIQFYSFPLDKNLKYQWKKICKVSSNKKKHLLCELHFDASAFDMAKQLKPDAVPTVKLLKRKASDKTITTSDSEPTRKNSKTLESKEIQHLEIRIHDSTSKAKPFRLTIEIDKKILRSCPLSKNICEAKLQPTNMKYTQDSQVQTDFVKNGKDKQNGLQCLVCKESFSDVKDLYKHVKIHFTCDICQTEFASRNTYEKHYKLHRSNMGQCPYKCHICELLFESKDELSKHNHVTMDDCNEDTEENRIEYCESCNMTFGDEILFRNHLNLHVEKIFDI